MWIVNQKWTKRFLVSHILGWIIFSMQTVWIVSEVRKTKKEN